MAESEKNQTEKPKVRTYRDLQVWQRSYEVCRAVYRATAGFPKSEAYGLSGQLRRAAVSVPSNIAEGMGRRTTAEFIRSLNIAYGSNCEMETQLLLAKDLGYTKASDHKKLAERTAEVERMLTGLMRSLRTNRATVKTR